MNGASTRAQRNKEKNGDADVHMKAQDENPRTSPAFINLAESVEGRSSTYLSQAAADGQDGGQSLAQAACGSGSTGPPSMGSIKEDP